MHLIVHRVLLAATVCAIVACEPRAVPQTEATSATAADSVATARMSEHFASPQGFSVTTLNARANWFTDSLLVLLRRDMGDGTSLGVLNWDPFTSYQDSATQFAFAGSHPIADTTFVAFAVRIVDAPATRASDTVTFAMRLENGSWRIADFRSGGHSLAHLISNSLAPKP